MKATAVRLSREVRARRGVALRTGAVVVVLVVGVLTTPDLLSGLSLRSMALIGSFLGIAAFAQTLCVLLGGIDLSIPFVIDSANVATLWLIDKHVSSVLVVVVVLAGCALIGALNGLVSYVVKGQAVVVTLGIGYFAVGTMQYVTSTSGSTGGAVFGTVPSWIGSLASVQSTVFGLAVPPSVLLFVVLALLLGVWLRRAWLGRSVYALGGNSIAAARVLVPERRVWVSVFVMSAVLSGIVGILLLGFSGGAVANVGDPYLFMSVAAVAVGGSSLAGGYGGIGYTVVGVLILTILNSVLVGSVLSNAMQQVVLGLLIIPAVAAYSRNPHPRLQV